jgi:hypothetical protein
MKLIQKMFFVFTVLAFILGGYVYSTMNIKERLTVMEQHKQDRVAGGMFSGFFPNHSVEGFVDKPVPASVASAEEGDENTNCPDLLVKSGAELRLYNTRKPNKEGENPIVFQNMDGYIEYLETQRKAGTVCPVLFLQKENDAQGKDVYRARPSPFNTGAGLPITSNLNVGVNTTPIEVADATRDFGYNQNNYAGFDPYGLYVGRVTDVDQVAISTEKEAVSDNPMDPNWGGVLHTQSAVESGKYDENIVSRVVYPTPKTEFIPIANPNIPPFPAAV